jgi:hypothetical protein
MSYDRTRAKIPNEIFAAWPGIGQMLQLSLRFFQIARRVNPKWNAV